MTKVGIVGVGHLAEYTVRGLRNGGWTHPIALSPRGATTGAELARDWNCEVLESNQAVADASDVVVLAPRPPQALEALRSITLRPDHILLSVVAGVSIDELKPDAGNIAALVRAIPVTAAEVCASPNIYYPENPVVADILNHCGTAIPLSSEADFDAGGVLSCVYGWYLALYDELTDCTVGAGMDEATARRIVTGMANGAAAVALAQKDEPIGSLTRRIAQPGSFTKLGLDDLEAKGAFAPWRDAYAKVLSAFRSI